MKFSNFRVRESVRTSGYKLKNKQYHIQEQFPKEIVEKRKALMPVLRKALGENRRAVLKYDKLSLTANYTWKRQETPLTQRLAETIPRMTNLGTYLQRTLETAEVKLRGNWRMIS